MISYIQVFLNISIVLSFHFCDPIVSFLPALLYKSLVFFHNGFSHFFLALYLPPDHSLLKMLQYVTSAKHFIFLSWIKKGWVRNCLNFSSLLQKNCKGDLTLNPVPAVFTSCNPGLPKLLHQSRDLKIPAAFSLLLPMLPG